MSGACLSVRNLRISIRDKRGSVPVVRGVGFDLEHGEILGLAGESGCGKSITALALMGLLGRPGFNIEADRLMLGSTDLRDLTARQWRDVRGARIAMIFQDPATALDPVFTIERQAGFTGSGLAMDALESVGFSDPAKALKSYPHELSGGMRQLVMIAMALASRPELVLADEPTTALDVTTQARVLHLLKKASEETGAGVLLISHDLAAAAQCAGRILVMYAGRIVEQAPPGELFARPLHPYTDGLLAALPRLDSAELAPVRPIPGQVPGPDQLPAGCPFEPRCGHASQMCRDTDPGNAEGTGHHAACHHPL